MPQVPQWVTGCSADGIGCPTSIGWIRLATGATGPQGQQLQWITVPQGTTGPPGQDGEMVEQMHFSQVSATGPRYNRTTSE